jgi:hypothetical protein
MEFSFSFNTGQVILQAGIGDADICHQWDFLNLAVLAGYRLLIQCPC